MILFPNNTKGAFARSKFEFLALLNMCLSLVWDDADDNYEEVEDKEEGDDEDDDDEDEDGDDEDQDDEDDVNDDEDDDEGDDESKGDETSLLS